MHAWSRYVQDYLDAHPGMLAAELAAKSGVSPQVLSTILKDTRTELVQRPDQRTVDLLAEAMGVGPEVLLSKVGEAMGLPVNEVVVVYDASRVSNDELVDLLRERLRKAGEGHERKSAPTTGAGGTSAPGDTAVPVGSTDIASEPAVRQAGASVRPRAKPRTGIPHGGGTAESTTL